MYSYCTALPKFLHHPSSSTTTLYCDKNLILKIHKNRSGQKQGGKSQKWQSSVLAGSKGGIGDTWDHLFPFRFTEVPESIPAGTEDSLDTSPVHHRTHTPSTHTLV